MVYTSANMERVERTVYPLSYCCPANSVITGLLREKRPSVSGAKIRAEYFDALVIVELTELWSLLPYAEP